MVLNLNAAKCAYRDVSSDHDLLHCPITTKPPQGGTKNHRQDDVPIRRHGQQHHNTAQRKRQSVKDRPNHLLQRRGAKKKKDNSRHHNSPRSLRVASLVTYRSAVRQTGGHHHSALDLLSVLKFLQDTLVIFPAQSAEEFEDHDEDDHPDAGHIEHAIVGKMPGGGEEAGVCDVQFHSIKTWHVPLSWW
jgi:hypothetical protein